MQRSFTDQMGRTVNFDYPPKRIVSIVPSQTELLFALGLDKEVVGLTKFCIHPIDKFVERTKVGGTKTLNLELIHRLNPDLIIGNKEENKQEQIESLSKDFPVWMSDIYTLEDARRMIKQVAELVDREPEGAYLNHLIGAGFGDLRTLATQRGIDQTVAYLIWREPYMMAGKNTFIDDVLAINGLRNVASQSRYPYVDLAELRRLNPGFIFLSSEPYPFKDKHIEELKNGVPGAKIMLVDGEMFSWYGSRLVDAVQYLFKLQEELL